MALFRHNLRLLWLSLTIAVLVAIWLLTIIPAGARATSKAVATDVIFTQPCVAHTFTVPAGVSSITIDAVGASGGSGVPTGPDEGLGGRVTATITVTPGEMLQVNVGGSGAAGDAGGAGGCNGGARGGRDSTLPFDRNGGGGGGASDVRQGGTALADRVVVAGGGGGGGAGLAGAGGSGGGTVGSSGSAGGPPDGGSGGLGAPFGNSGIAATNGGDGNSSGGGGGGGGEGGRGGDAGTGSGGGGGGGGGSGYVIPSATNTGFVSGVQLGSGRVTITYNQPTAVKVTSISAKRAGKGVLVRWQTASELGLLGFNLYRAQKGKLVRLNHALVPGVVFRGTTTGHAYSWLDRSTPRQRGARRYRLQSVNVDGKRSWVGTAVVAG